MSRPTHSLNVYVVQYLGIQGKRDSRHRQIVVRRRFHPTLAIIVSSRLVFCLSVCLILCSVIDLDETRRDDGDWWTTPDLNQNVLPCHRIFVVLLEKNKKKKNQSRQSIPGKFVHRDEGGELVKGREGNGGLNWNSLQPDTRLEKQPPNSKLFLRRCVVSEIKCHYLGAWPVPDLTICRHEQVVLPISSPFW